MSLYPGTQLCYYPIMVPYNLLAFRLAKGPLQRCCHKNTIEKLYQKSSISKIILQIPSNNELAEARDTISETLPFVLCPEYLAAFIIPCCLYASLHSDIT